MRVIWNISIYKGSILPYNERFELWIGFQIALCVIRSLSGVGWGVSRVLDLPSGEAIYLRKTNDHYTTNPSYVLRIK
jgi:hypothetical protein